MKVWIVLLKGFGYSWLTLGAILIAAGIAGTWMKDGFSAAQELLNPFNLKNYLAMFIMLAPGGGALVWAEKLAAKNKQRQSSENRI
jgi:hypothetical protein